MQKTRISDWISEGRFPRAFPRVSECKGKREKEYSLVFQREGESKSIPSERKIRRVGFRAQERGSKARIRIAY